MQFGQSVEEFVADLRILGRSDRTIEGHEQELNRLGGWLVETSHAWQTIQRNKLQVYVRTRAHLGFSSRSNMLCTLRTFYKWAVEQGYVALSPAASFKTPKKPKPLPRALTLDQLRVLVEHLRLRNGRRARRDEALMTTALYAGLRAKELATLRWPMVDFASACINIELSKMGKGRAVRMHSTLADVLKTWRDIQALGADAPVFSLDGKMFNSNRVGKIVRPIARKLGIPLTAHVLRHTFATQAIRRSGNLFSVQRALGHSDVKQTQIYLASDPSDSDAAVDSLPDIGEW